MNNISLILCFLIISVLFSCNKSIESDKREKSLREYVLEDSEKSAEYSAVESEKLKAIESFNANPEKVLSSARIAVNEKKWSEAIAITREYISTKNKEINDIFELALSESAKEDAAAKNYYKKEMYRAPSAGDYGAYYVLRHEKMEGGIHKVLTSRIGKGDAYTNFTELKISCSDQEIFGLAESEEEGAKDMPSNTLKDYSSQSKWTSLVRGSSKYDLVQYVCRKYQ